MINSTSYVFGMGGDEIIFFLIGKYWNIISRIIEIFFLKTFIWINCFFTFRDPSLGSLGSFSLFLEFWFCSLLEDTVKSIKTQQGNRKVCIKYNEDTAMAVFNDILMTV